MDLSQYKITQDAIKMTVKHPVTGDDTDAALYVIGMDHPDMRAVERKVQKAVLQGMQGNEEIDVSQSAIDILAPSIKGWENIVLDGEEVEYSDKAARKLLADLPWLREQLDQFVGKRSNFFTASPSA